MSHTVRSLITLLAIPITAAALAAQPRADLVVSSFLVPRGHARAGKTFGISVTTKNQGAAPARSSFTAIVLSTDDRISDQDVYLGAGYDTGSLAPGASTTRVVIVTLPHHLRGRMTFGAIADATSWVTESVETNNTRGVTRDIEPFRGPGHFLSYTNAKISNRVGPVSATHANITHWWGAADIAITAPASPHAFYLMMWSGQPDRRLDEFASFGLSLVNTKMFPRWLGRTDAAGRATAGFFWQRPGPVRVRRTLHTHAVFFAPTGRLTAASDNTLTTTIITPGARP